MKGHQVRPSSLITLSLPPQDAQMETGAEAKQSSTLRRPGSGKRTALKSPAFRPQAAPVPAVEEGKADKALTQPPVSSTLDGGQDRAALQQQLEKQMGDGDGDSSSFAEPQSNGAAAEREHQPSGTASFAKELSQPPARMTPSAKPSKNLFAQPLQDEAAKAQQTPVHQPKHRLQLDGETSEDSLVGHRHTNQRPDFGVHDAERLSPSKRAATAVTMSPQA